MAKTCRVKFEFDERSLVSLERLREQGAFVMSDAIVTVLSEAEKLREAIRDVGFEVMQTSGRWSIHDVSKLAIAEQEKTSEIIGKNIDLEIRVKQLESTIKEAFDLFKAADAERLNDVHKAEKEAEKWKNEGDMYGWNFHQGKAGGMTQASIIFYRVFRRLKPPAC